MCRTFHFWFSSHFFVRFTEKKAPIKFYGILLHFSGTYEVAKFWVVKLYLDVSDAIHENDHTKNANCGLPVNVWIFLLKSFCFMMKKDHFKQKLLFWSQVPFKMLLFHSCEPGFFATGTLATNGLKIFPLTKNVATSLPFLMWEGQTFKTICLDEDGGGGYFKTHLIN